MKTDPVAAGRIPTRAPFVTQREPLEDVVEAYLHFDRRDEGWLRTVLSTG
ncbi:UNVERIFIED_CONTAM: hypothetical protein RF653_18505 [Kocuria sp. CPCC 205316]